MRRREFVIIGGSALLWPIEAGAQRGRTVPHIGVLDFFSSATGRHFLEPFNEGLAELGYVNGRNIHVEYRSASNNGELAAAIAAGYVRRPVDIIIALATPAAHAAKRATATIPIVFSVADPVATGLVSSVARPGGNMTGVSTTSPDLAGKRLELLRELRPEGKRFAFLGAANDPQTKTFTQATQQAANAVGVTLRVVLVTGPAEFEGAFDSMARERIDGLIIQPLFVGHRAILARLALRHRLPSVSDQPSFAMDGALAAYGVNRRVPFRRMATYVDRILKGTRPSELPIELPTSFQLAINLKTARELGIAVSPMLIGRADEVIE